MLLQQRTNLKVRVEGLTPLHLAAVANNNPEVITSLIGHGIDVNIKDDDGWSPWHIAIECKSIFTICPSLDYDEDDNNVAVVSALLENKADLNAVDNLGCFALFYAQHYDAATGVEDY